MADNPNAKNAIEEYLNALLLDEYDELEVGVGADEANQKSYTKEYGSVELSAQQAGAQLEIVSQQYEQQQEHKESQEQETQAVEEIQEIKVETQVDAKLAYSGFGENSAEVTNIETEQSANTADFEVEFEKGNGALGADETEIQQEAKNDGLSAIQVSAEKEDQSFGLNKFRREARSFEAKQQTQDASASEGKYSFDVKQETSSWLGQNILMPKLRLATGEEVVAKTGTDKNIKLNPSDFNVPPPPANWDNGRPEWGQNRFDCLLFKVMGLTLAVPLVELGGILRIEEAPKALFGQPDWFLGLMNANNENVYLVDTAKWVLPPALIEKQNGEAYEFVIKIHNSSWGLCCNKVAEAISLNPDQVKWRSAGSKRPWLAGTVIKEMCALVDVSAFAQLLQSGHGNMQPVNVSGRIKQDK